MKVDWKKRYNDLKREHNAKMKQLADEFGGTDGPMGEVL